MIIIYTHAHTIYTHMHIPHTPHCTRTYQIHHTHHTPRTLFIWLRKRLTNWGISLFIFRAQYGMPLATRTNTYTHARMHARTHVLACTHACSTHCTHMCILNCIFFPTQTNFPARHRYGVWGTCAQLLGNAFKCHPVTYTCNFGSIYTLFFSFCVK